MDKIIYEHSLINSLINISDLTCIFGAPAQWETDGVFVFKRDDCSFRMRVTVEDGEGKYYIDTFIDPDRDTAGMDKKIEAALKDWTARGQAEAAGQVHYEIGNRHRELGPAAAKRAP